MSEPTTIHSSQADVWYLKQVRFGNGHVKIITQNFNGSVFPSPCNVALIPPQPVFIHRHLSASPFSPVSLIDFFAGNILVLRRQIQILPDDRTTVSYEFLSQLVGEYLLTNCPDIDISAALSILPTTTSQSSLPLPIPPRDRLAQRVSISIPNSPMSPPFHPIPANSTSLLALASRSYTAGSSTPTAPRQTPWPTSATMTPPST